MDGAIRLKPGVEWQEVDGEVVVLDLNTSAYLVVNGTGAVLWPSVVEGTTSARLVDVLIERFPVDAERARADVGVFVDRLRSLTVIDDGP